MSFLAAILRLALLAAIPSGPGLAETSQDLWMGRAVITGTAEPERTRGIRAALADVIAKLTGCPIDSDARSGRLLDDPDRFVAELTLTDRMKGIPVHDEQGTRERPHDLVARFDEGRLRAALAAEGLRIWEDERPLVAVRLAIETGATRFEVTEEGSDGYGQRLALKEIAERRGLPIQLPSHTSTEDTHRSGRDAPKNQGPLLVGRLKLSSGGFWDISWSFHWAGHSDGWDRSGITFDDAMRIGIEGAIKRLKPTDAGN